METIISIIVEVFHSLLLMSFCAVWFYNIKALRENLNDRIDTLQEEVDLLKPENN